VVVSSAKALAEDTRLVAQAKYAAAKERLLEKSRAVSSATDEQLALTRRHISNEPLKAFAIAVGIGYFLGRFVFNGR
jgi:ElaB/YqjD/DUF883 family membrane-anchored ribosome-binding protein